MQSSNLSLNRDKIRDTLEQTLLPNGPGSPHSPVNLLLAGPWGSGKTTLLKGLQEEWLEKNHVQVIWFSPWEVDSEQDARMEFLRVLNGHLHHAESKKSWQWLWLKSKLRTVVHLLGRLKPEDGEVVVNIFQKLLKISAGGSLIMATPSPWSAAGASISFAILLARFLNKTNLSDENKENPATGTNQTTQELRKRIHLILIEILKRQKKQSILLLVDDLDRVRPEQAIGFLDSLFHLFLPHDHDDIESWPLSSIWAINTAVLEQALYEQYRNLPAFDPNAYIEKIFRCRVTVPPLFSSTANNSSSETLWKNEIDNHPDLIKRLFSTEKPNAIARKLSETTNIRAMGNLRLHNRVRQDCIRYWRKKYDPDKPHLPSPPPSLDQLAYQARLLTFTGIFPSFRDEIALFDSAWAPFINHLNARHARLSLDPIVNPTYRQIENSDLITLLMDFGVISYSLEDNRYHLNREAQQRFKQNLAELVLEGF